MIRSGGLVVLGAGVIACGGPAATPNAGAPPDEEAPVAVNAEPAVQYPPELYGRRVEGDVVLRLFVDSLGRVSPESTRVSESSGFAALDSAAVRGVPLLRYSPGRRHGLPVPMAFLQTVEFRHPGGSGTGVLPPATADTPTTARAARRDTARPAPRPQPQPVRTAAPVQGGDSGAVRRDTNARKADSAPPAPPPDTTKAQPDSNAAAS